MADKQNFEKDIDVPSKQKIMYDYNAKDCEQCSSDSVCCYCKNLTCYKLEEQLEAYKMEAEEGKEINAELKAENDELKRLIAKQKNAKIQLSKLKDKQYKEFCDMKQTLIEIKKVCNSVENIENVNSLYDAKLSGMYLQANKILQKIKECEAENE